jgi:hypothetical protein
MEVVMYVLMKSLKIKRKSDVTVRNSGGVG